MEAGGQKPRCVIVTGPRGAGKTRWISGQVEAALARDPQARCAVLIAEQGRSRLAVAEAGGRVLVRTHWLPCLCCPEAAGVIGALQAMDIDWRPQHLFIEIPMLAALSLCADYDRAALGPRELVLVCGARWGERVLAGSFSLFHQRLLDEADTVVCQSSRLRKRLQQIRPLDLVPNGLVVYREHS